MLESQSVSACKRTDDEPDCVNVLVGWPNVEGGTFVVKRMPPTAAKKLQNASKKQLQSTRAADAEGGSAPLIPKDGERTLAPPPSAQTWFALITKVSLWLWVHLAGCFVVRYFENQAFDECSETCVGELCAGEPGSRCWTVIDTVYFWVMSVSLATYGDVAANSTTGKWIVLGLSPVALIALARIVEAYQEERAERVDTTLATRLAELRELITSPADRNRDGQIGREEFVLYYCAKHKLVPTRDVCATADEEFDALDLSKDGKLDVGDLDILQRAVTLEEQMAEVQSALGRDPHARVTLESFVAAYRAKVPTATDADARARFAELDKDNTALLTPADIEHLLAQQQELLEPTLTYNRDYSGAKGDVARTHPLMRVVVEESSAEDITMKQAATAFVRLAAYVSFCFVIFRRWSVDLSFVPSSLLPAGADGEEARLEWEGTTVDTDAPTTIALATSLLATLPTMVGGMPPHTQTIRAILIPLTGVAFLAVGQQTVITCVRWVEQQTWDTLKRQHARFLYETARAAATAKQWRDAPSLEELPDIGQVQRRFAQIGKLTAFDEERMHALEHSAGDAAEEEVFGKGRRDEDALGRMQSMAEMGGLRR